MLLGAFGLLWALVDVHPMAVRAVTGGAAAWRWPWQRPAEPPAEPAPPPSPLAGRVVAVDPGHGGPDGGVSHGGLLEKEVNLDVALRLRGYLEAVGARVVMTRETDHVPFAGARGSLDVRLQRALQGEAHIFVSIHANSYPDPGQFGAQAFYHPSSEPGRRLAWLIQEELVRLQPENYREALAADYYVLRLCHCPAVLVEVGFLSSPDDRRRLSDPSWRDGLARAILRGLERFAAGERPHPSRPTARGAGPPAGFIPVIYPYEPL